MGELTVTVPVATVQVGCAVTLATGALGVAGWAVTVKANAALIQLLVFFELRLYVPAITLVNIPLVFV